MSRSIPAITPPAAILEVRVRHSLWTRCLTPLALFGFYLVGVAFWIWFFQSGHLQLTAYDWPKEAWYFRILQRSIREGSIPYHIEVPPAYLREFPHLDRGRRFLGLPEIVLSPHILLLGFMRVERFILVHNLILYSLGFLGCLLLLRRYHLGLIPFTALFLLFNFNGYITSRLGVGQLAWSGYFLLSFFCLYVLECVEEPGSLLAALKLAVVLFGLLLQGSVHVATWCWLFLGLLVAFNPRLWRQGLVAVGFSGLLASFRLVPAAVAFWGFRDYVFVGGYPTLTELLEGLLVIHGPGTMTGIGPHWWEFDVYSGVLGLILLAYFGIYRRWDPAPALQPYCYPALDLPLVILVFLSINYIYKPVYDLPVPFLNGERISSRFIIIPVVLLLVLAVIRLEKVLRQGKFGLKGMALFTLALVETFFSLLSHARVWNVGKLETLAESHWHERTEPVVIQVDDPGYVASISIGIAMTLVAAFAWIYLYRRSQRCGVRAAATSGMQVN